MTHGENGTGDEAKPRHLTMMAVVGGTNKVEAVDRTRTRRPTTSPFKGKRDANVRCRSSEARRGGTLVEEMMMKIRKGGTGTVTTASVNRTRIAAGGVDQVGQATEMETAGAAETAPAVGGRRTGETPAVEAATATAIRKGCQRLTRTTRTGP